MPATPLNVANLDHCSATPSGMWGSDLFVINTNSMAVQTDSLDDPHAVMEGTATNHANVVPVGVPKGAAFLQTFHLYTGSNPATALITRSYGLIRCPPSTSALANRRLPYDVFPLVFNAPEHASMGNTTSYPFSGYFIPLFDRYNLSTANALHSITYPNTPHVVKDSTTSSGLAFSLSRGGMIAVDGAAFTLTLVTQAAATPTAGVVLGRWLQASI